MAGFMNSFKITEPAKYVGEEPRLSHIIYIYDEIEKELIQHQVENIRDVFKAKLKDSIQNALKPVLTLLD